MGTFPEKTTRKGFEVTLFFYWDWERTGLSPDFVSNITRI